MNKDDYGIKGIIANYVPKELIKDLIIPMICGVVFVFVQAIHMNSLEDNLDKLLNYAIVYLPVMATIILTAYTMMIGALKSSLDIVNLRKTDSTDYNEARISKIQELRISISASFGASILLSILSLGTCWLVYFVKGFEIVSKYADQINLMCYGFIITMIIYPIVAIIGIVSDMFSISKI